MTAGDRSALLGSAAKALAWDLYGRRVRPDACAGRRGEVRAVNCVPRFSPERKETHHEQHQRRTRSALPAPSNHQPRTSARCSLPTLASFSGLKLWTSERLTVGEPIRRLLPNFPEAEFPFLIHDQRRDTVCH